VIMTSNLGTEQLDRSTVGFEQSSTGIARDVAKGRVLEELRRFFRPEFLNRVDDVIVFEPLDKEQIAEIVDIQVRRFAERLAERRLTLELTDDARRFLAERGWDPALGARPLKRLIQKEIQDRLALALLEGQITDGDRVVVDRSGDGLSVGPAPAA
jgi:ATP-dependent Clp protease ATP-binding subunit ClpA